MQQATASRDKAFYDILPWSPNVLTWSLAFTTRGVIIATLVILVIINGYRLYERTDQIEPNSFIFRVTQGPFYHALRTIFL